MRKIKEQDWTFVIDETETNEYYKNRTSTCQCAYCRNFKKAYLWMSANARIFLEQFAIDVSNPEDITWFHPEKNEMIDYILYYPVKGEAFSEKGYELDFQGENSFVSVAVQPLEKGPNFEMKSSGFCLQVFGISLPWVLEEPMPQMEEEKTLFQRIKKKIWK